MTKIKEFDHDNEDFWKAVGLNYEDYMDIFASTLEFYKKHEEVPAESVIVECILLATKGKKLTRKELAAVYFKIITGTYQAIEDHRKTSSDIK